MSNKKPIHFLIFKIVGILALGLAVFGFVLLIKGFGDFESNNYLIGMFLGPIGLFAGIACSILGWRPEIMKMRSKSIKYIQEENMEDLKSVATNTATIMEDAVSKTANAVKEGLVENMFCKHCGEAIDKDSKFCKKCGKEQ